ncbi:hypothetical protein HanRHA438_Chr16g0786961 [Helianthus annuus]|uniref:Uncharacterized protein n=1 Tax=Helianthus annuus TaxID=4232 RepID=A0A9K3DXE2_HELAN|nr:hypothetical protein HanXRQr2_Chr16g0776181 [Helianthus annuus]KAJ0462507.1 hypothetical protein HanHA89_Chr16g0684131 [Helianthus annuus]KAJ0646769.1 hypothetical protein HanOQP8_Chr16g0638831 [Helianthus annuus]KAJ0838248.1 hypothetical protein HanRHA438_Chr16g0786961 [Helianthus annuus]
MLQVLMSSSESNRLSDEHNPMAIVSDDEVAPAPEIFTSDSETDLEIMSDDDDFQSFALPEFGDDVPLTDDVLTLPLPLHGHPDGEHLVEPILIHAIPLAAIPAVDWPFVVGLDDDVDVPVFEVDHPDDELGDGEVFDIAILDVTSPVVSVIDISSDSDPDFDADSFESVTSSALRAAGLEAYPTDDDAVSVAPATLVHVPTPTDTPPHTPTHVASDNSSQPPVPVDHSSWIRSIRFALSFLCTPRTHEGEPSGHPHVPPPKLSPCFQSPRSFLPCTMPLSDPYHPSHHIGYTRDDLLLSLRLQVEILYRRVMSWRMRPMLDDHLHRITHHQSHHHHHISTTCTIFTTTCPCTC